MTLRYSKAQEMVLAQGMDAIVKRFGPEEAASVMFAVAHLTSDEPTIAETLETIERVVHIRHNVIVPLPLELAKKADYAAQVFSRSG